MPRIKRWFFGFLLVLLWPSVFMLGAPATVSSKNAVSSASEEAIPGVDNAVQMAQQEIRDPFAKAPVPEAETSRAVVAQAVAPEIKVELQGIGFGSKEAYAVIGGEVFYEGDEKKGIKLVEVRRREVDILVSGGKITVPLFPDQELQKARNRAKQKSLKENPSGD